MCLCRNIHAAETDSIKSRSSVSAASSKKIRKSELISVLKKPRLTKTDLL